MRYNVGIDFGTHQTKVCIEDALNKHVPIYEFLEYTKPNGSKTVLLPSIVQINKDHTVSYGFANPDEALIIAKDGNNPPEPNAVPDPVYVDLRPEPTYDKLPQKPESKNTGYLAILEKLLPISDEMRKWKQECASIKRANEYRRQAWLNEKREVLAENARREAEWKRNVEQAKKDYQRAYDEWKKDVEKTSQMRFRYFKQASFFSTSWPYDYSPETLSALYLAYVCLCIRDRIGYDFTIQLGAPLGASKNLSKQQRSAAKRIWSRAMFLADKYQSLDNYLSATIEALLEDLNRSSIPNAPVFIIPEASAGLLAIREKLGSGMFLLIDIGGGTTDVGMCSVRSGQNGQDKTLGIHKVYSFNKGLNFIFEEYQKEHPRMSIAEIQDFFRKAQDRGEFVPSIGIYQDELYNQIKKVVDDIIRAFLSRRSVHHMDRSDITIAMQNKPIYLCGGGSVYRKMREFSTSDLYFSDKTPINKSLLNIEHLANAGNIPEELFPIVATAYGLAKPVDTDEELDEQPLEAFFNDLKPDPNSQPQEKTQENDYSLARGCC